ncbi:hypothetical protein LIER_02670 [Lithospermum erythrorhizon]|uniref:Gag-pol polyprotein n=1 Tax=Lithospermum erythrorhizon TaxID=34254 RepID=A0AAV3NQD5_LITER
MSNEKLVRKVLRTLPKRFSHKVIAIKEAQDLSTIGFDELIVNLTTFEMMFEATEPNKEKRAALQNLWERSKKIYSNQKAMGKEGGSGKSCGFHICENCPTLRMYF